MAQVLHIPDKGQWATVRFRVGTRDSGSEVVEDKAPLSLADAVALLGEEEVFALFTAQYVVRRQGELRPKADKPAKPRHKSVLEQLEEQRLAALEAK